MKTVTLNPSSIHSGNLILVNSDYPYKCSAKNAALTPVLGENRGVLLNYHAVSLLSKVMEEINGWGRISTISGWRSAGEQQEIYTQSLKDKGLTFTKKYVALPTHSEHETGLAFDLALMEKNIDFICPNFPYDGICQLFRQKSIALGFIERYPKGKEAITGIAHEPWHFRYVGSPHAEIMEIHGFALEEYHTFLKQYSHGKRHYQHIVKHMEISVSYLKANETGCTYLEIAESIPYTVSGNNIDGFVITEWRECHA